MKIALISPKGRLLGENPKLREFWENSKEIQFYKRFWSGISSGLLVIGALTPKDIDVVLVDENVEVINFDEDYDLVALSAMTQQASRAYEIADEFRKKGIKVVMGGIHATILPQEAKQYVDSVIIGEAEETWPELLKDLQKGKMQPFYHSRKIVDLQYAPLPRYELLNPENYKIIWAQTTRGCPYDCDFCTVTKLFGHKFRYKSIKQVLREVEHIKSIAKNSWIGFGDDNMFVNRRYSKDLLRHLIPLRIKWMTQTDISIAEDDGLLELLKESGCHILFIGFESLSKESLGLVDRSGFKVKKLEKYKFYIEKIQEKGIGVMGAFILGFDSDDKTIFKKTADFIINNHMYSSQVSVLTPFPGTRIRSDLEKQNRLLSKKWKYYTFWDVNFVPRKMTVDELQDGVLDVLKAIYNRDVLISNDRYFKKIYSKRMNG